MPVPDRRGGSSCRRCRMVVVDWWWWELEILAGRGARGFPDVLPVCLPTQGGLIDSRRLRIEALQMLHVGVRQVGLWEFHGDNNANGQHRLFSLSIFFSCIFCPPGQQRPKVEFTWQAGLGLPYTSLPSVPKGRCHSTHRTDGPILPLGIHVDRSSIFFDVPSGVVITWFPQTQGLTKPN